MSHYLFPVFGAALRRAARLIRLVGLAALLTSCAVPATYGPYYRPTYLGPADEARLQPTGKSAAPPRMLWIEPRNRQCSFLLWADADEANLVLGWSVFRDHRIKERLPCKVVDTPLDAPLLIQDLDTGRQISVPRLRTIRPGGWGGPPRLDIRQEVDLASLIPRYGAAPPSERRYTVSFEVERKFDGPLPERVTIQLPELVVEGRRFRPPALVLQRGERYTSDSYEYVAVSPTRLLHSEALAEFGGHAGAGQSGGGSFAIAFAGTYVWHDEPNVLRLASTFTGFPFAYKEDGNTKDATKSTVRGGSTSRSSPAKGCGLRPIP